MPASRKPTMGDIAREAGVSLATFDRVLNGRGGVAPGKAGAILTAARSLKLDRSLAQRPSRILRVAVLIQAPRNPFHAQLGQGIQMAGRLYHDINLQFLVHHIEPKHPARTADIARAQVGRCEGMIVTGPDDPRVALALGELAARIPVVTLADEITGSGRAAYVGPDDHRAGRIAGDIMGRQLRPAGGHVVIMLGRGDIRGHREREAGFRAVLADFYPETSVTDVLESGEDPDQAGMLVARALAADPRALGVYHCTRGVRQVVEALRRLGRPERPTLIVHELTDDCRILLRGREVDAVIDQNPALEAQVAVETVARLLGRLEGEPASTLTDLRIFMPENA
jgi:LacI family transcriptional regulator